MQTLVCTPVTRQLKLDRTVVSFDQFEIEDVNPNAILNFTLRENRQDWPWARLDNVVVSAVPEPATLLLVGLGLLGIAGASRKKFKK